MKKSKGAKAISELAKREGVSEDEIRRDIQVVIDMGMANPDPKVKALWDEMISKGIKPTPEKLIVYLAEKIKKEQ